VIFFLFYVDLSSISSHGLLAVNKLDKISRVFMKRKNCSIIPGVITSVVSPFSGVLTHFCKQEGVYISINDISVQKYRRFGSIKARVSQLTHGYRFVLYPLRMHGRTSKVLINFTFPGSLSSPCGGVSFNLVEQCSDSDCRTLQ